MGDQFLVAYGRVAVSGGSTVSATQTAVSPLAFTPGTAAFDASKINVGFAVGGGMEGRFSYWLPPNWTWKLEYLYLDLGSIDTPTTPFAILSSVTGLISNITGTITTHTHFTDNIVRVGLNYQFH